MNLPFIFDLAIGLIFTYLILSLLASEIQELLTTLLQWRAAHLKKSIEILLTGGEGTPNDEKVKDIVKNLYSNPLIKNISQESKEGIEALLRRVIRFLITLGRNKRVTLKGNEPSYIPSETFASTLLERMELSQFYQKVTALNLQRMIKEEIIAKIEGYINDENFKVSNKIRQTLESDFKTLRDNLNNIRKDFYAGKATLLASTNQVKNEIDTFIEIYSILSSSTSSASLEQDLNEQNSSDITKFVTQLKSLKNNIFYNTNDLIRRLQPSIAYILDLAVGEAKDKGKQINELSKTYKAFRKQFENLDKKDELYEAYEDLKKDIEEIEKHLPYSVRESLSALARRAQINLKHAQAEIQVIEDEIHQFKTEVQVWFDRSMDRASGVYKRNAKGISFLIGFLLAFAVNADTFHIVSRLATDFALRNALATSAELMTQNCLPPQGNTQGNQDNTGTADTKYLECIRKGVNQTMPVPIGWDEVNRKQQDQESQGWFWLPLSRRFLGWILSGFAIMMGAPFWFELLGKIINVRNAGGKPSRISTNK